MSPQLPLDKNNLFLKSLHFCFIWSCCFAFFAITQPTIMLFCGAADGYSFIEALLLIPAGGLLIASIIIRLIKVKGQHNGRKVHFFFPVMILAFLGTAIADLFLLSRVSLFYQSVLVAFILISLFYSFLLFIGFIMGLKKSLISSTLTNASSLSFKNSTVITTKTTPVENSSVDDSASACDICYEDNNNTNIATIEELTAHGKFDSFGAVSSVSEISISGLRSLLPHVEYPKIEGLFRRYHWTMFFILMTWSIPFGQSTGIEIALKCLASCVLSVMVFSATQETL